MGLRGSRALKITERTEIKIGKKKKKKKQNKRKKKQKNLPKGSIQKECKVEGGGVNFCHMKNDGNDPKPPFFKVKRGGENVSRGN